MISFRLVNGRRIDLAHPRTEDVDVPAIACGLSKICRFTGQLRQFYSVAEHALMVSMLVDPWLRFPALHHDDSEAYLNDLSRNLKHSEFLAGYRVLEDLWTRTIERALQIDLSPRERRMIKAADDLVAIFERAVLRHHEPWNPEVHVLQALHEGFVSSTVPRDELLLLCDRMPPEMMSEFPLHTLDPHTAEQIFLINHHKYLPCHDHK